MCILLPILYILFNWGSSKQAQEFYNARLSSGSNNKPRETPKLVEGVCIKMHLTQHQIQQNRIIYHFFHLGLGNFEPNDIPKKDGPGQYGKPYHLPPEKQNEGSESEMEYGMNIAVSDIISLDREIKDTRLEECRHWDYPKDLPTTSVIIVFHNEGKNTHYDCYVCV